MTESSMNNSVLNIKTFYGYLEHVINSIDADNYHEPTVKKLSDMIEKYYQDINCSEEDSVCQQNLSIDTPIIDDEHSITTQDSEESKSSSNIGALFESQDSESETDSDTSDEEDEEEDASSKESVSQNRTTKEMIKQDVYLNNFLNGVMDNSKIELYKDSTFLNRLDLFLNDHRIY